MKQFQRHLSNGTGNPTDLSKPLVVLGIQAIHVHLTDDLPAYPLPEP